MILDIGSPDRDTLRAHAEPVVMLAASENAQ
jgi:hypothetical protein